MNFGDKKKMLIAGGIAAVAIILLLVFVMKGKKSAGGAGGAAGGAGAGGAQTAQTGTTPAPGQVGAAAPGAPAAGVGRLVAGQNLFGSVSKGSGQMSALSRPDPLIYLEPPPPVITPEERTPLPAVITVAGGLRPGGSQAVGIAETIANRRVAGVKFNGGAWAILEKEGEKTFVVKPGDVIEGTKITAIARDSVYVTDADGQRWQVPLRGSGPGGATPVTTRRLPGMPGSPSEEF